MNPRFNAEVWVTNSDGDVVHLDAVKTMSGRDYISSVLVAESNEDVVMGTPTITDGIMTIDTDVEIVMLMKRHKEGEPPKRKRADIIKRVFRW